MFVDFEYDAILARNDHLSFYGYFKYVRYDYYVSNIQQKDDFITGEYKLVSTACAATQAFSNWFSSKLDQLKAQNLSFITVICL